MLTPTVWQEAPQDPVWEENPDYATDDPRYGVRPLGRRFANALVGNIDLRQGFQEPVISWGNVVRNMGRIGSFIAGGGGNSGGGLKVDPVIYFSRDDFVYRVNQILDIADPISTLSFGADWNVVRSWLTDCRDVIRSQPDYLIPETIDVPRLVCPELRTRK